jgi:hypothetical protein
LISDGGFVQRSFVATFGVLDGDLPQRMLYTSNYS